MNKPHKKESRMAIYQDYAKKRKKYKSNMDGYGMIREDMSAPANMPQKEMVKMYPGYAKNGNSSNGLNDTAKGIDKQIKNDMKGRKKGGGSKY